MNALEAKERALQEAADQAERERVTREEKRWHEAQRLCERKGFVQLFHGCPYVFADEISERRAEDEVRLHRAIDDYSSWLGRAL